MFLNEFKGGNALESNGIFFFKSIDSQKLACISFNLK